MTPERKGMLVIAGTCVLVFVLSLFLWRAFTGDFTPDNASAPDTDTSSEWDGGEPEPPFSIPKLPGCAPATGDELAAVTATLGPGSGLSTSSRIVDGDDVYIAAIITYDDEPVDREPGLWVRRDGRLYAVGDTASLSSAPNSSTIDLFGDRDAANIASGCAAGY